MLFGGVVRVICGGSIHGLLQLSQFGAEDENSLTAWMERNLLFAYLANDKKDELESFLIDSLLPPLNVEGSKAATLQRVHELRCDK